MPIFGFDSFEDMRDGGGAGRSGPTYSFEGSAFDPDRTNNYVAPAGTDPNAKPSGSGGALSSLGGLLGFVVGGPAGAAIGSGIGSILSGGSFGNALATGAGSYLTGAMGGQAGMIANALQGGNPAAQAGSSLAGIIPGLQGAVGQGAAQGAAPGQAPAPAQGGLNGLLQAFNNPLMMAVMLKATEPKNVSVTTPQQRRQLETGERTTYGGTAAPDFRYQGLARGGMVRGPGTATSDSIPAKIYQNGKPVREARLSDGEFVMTNRAVRGAGGGDRAKGAAEMYRMMRQFERRA